MAETWTSIKQFTDIKFERTSDGIAKITINRPEVRNAFRPKTVGELKEAFDMARDDAEIGVVVITGEGTEAFCSGGDQRVRGKGGYVDPKEKIPRLNILDVQKQIRSMPKPVVAMVAGYAIGGGHVLHVVCDLTIAADNARFGQTGPRVGSFDAGLGSAYLARIVGQKKAREIWFLCRQRNQISRAFFCPTMRARYAEPRPASNEPTRGPVWPKRALSAAMVRSQTTCSTCPPPMA